jgi:hypothetical protein
MSGMVGTKAGRMAALEGFDVGLVCVMTWFCLFVLGLVACKEIPWHSMHHSRDL